MYIAVIGTVFVDHKAYPYGPFIPDGRNPGYEHYMHGGVGRNIAENLAHIGLDTQLVSLVDESGSGTDVVERLKKNRVGTKYIRHVDKGMGKWIAVFDERGEVVASISVRPELASISDILKEQGDEIIKDAESIILEIDIEEETLKTTFELAKKYEKRVFAAVSVMSIALERRKYFGHLRGFICNLQEAEMLFEHELSKMSVSEIEAFISERRESVGLELLIVTMGDRGAVYCGKDVKSGSCVAKEVNLVDSTGAGDGFAAGAYAAISRGLDISSAVEIGTRTAAFVIEEEENVCPDFNEDIFGLNK